MTEQTTRTPPPGSIGALLIERGLRKVKRPGVLVFDIFDAADRQVFRGTVTEVGAWLEADCPPQSENDR